MAMPQLSHKDWSRMSEFVRTLHEEQDIDGFHKKLMTGLYGLIPCDNLGYNEIDGVTSDVVFDMVPYEQEVVDMAPQLAPHMPSHPILNYYRTNPDRQARQMSDFMSEREFRQTGMYRDVYRHINTTNQIALLLSDFGARTECGMAINRDHGSFSRRDCDVLDLLRPHIVQARNNLLTLTRNRWQIERDNWGYVTLRRNDSIAFVSIEGERLLRKFFPDYGKHFVRLPDPLLRWLRHVREVLQSDCPTSFPELFVAQSATSHFTARFLFEGNGVTRLILSESVLIDPKQLQSAWQLTQREAEVLQWMVEAKSNADIAQITNTSPRTVEKHVERILHKLQVENRTAAARKAADFLAGSTGRRSGAN
jgi:DNA-binding CsgD family transcriptional regulator